MSEQNKALVRRHYTDFDRKPSPLDETLAPNFVAHAPGAPGPMNLAAFKQFHDVLFAGFPDGRHTVEDMVAEGDKVASRFTMHATHRGTFQGVPATGKPITLTGMITDRISGGKIVEKWFEYDAIGLMMQIGAIPAPK